MPRSTSTLAAPVRGAPLDTPLLGLIKERSSTLGAMQYVAHARDDRDLSFRGLALAVETEMARIDEAGVAAGGTIGVVCGHPIDFAVAFLATMASGRWAAPFDPATPLDGPSGLVAAMARVQVDAVVADRPAPAGIDIGWMDASSETPPAPARRGSDRAAADAPPSGGAILVSSGTTGPPKVMQLDQRQLLYTAGGIARHHRFSPSDRGFNPLPLFHVNAEVVGLLASLVAGSCLVLDDRFHRTNFWNLMAEQRITWINAVPAIIARLAERDTAESIPAGIRFVRSASAPLPVATLRAFEAVTAIPVVETYGMSEAASQITANPMVGVRKPGSVGRPVGVELRIVPDGGLMGRPPPPGAGGTAGQVEIRGPSVITAYGGGLHRERFDADGWLRTGDLGHLDEDGYLYLDARSDDVINRGGEKVLPREIEEFLLVDPDITAASVVGQDDPVFGQVPVAYVVLRGGRGADPGGGPAVLARSRLRLQAALVRSKRPVSLRIVGELPTGPTGKVQRRALRANAVPVVCHLDCR